MVGKSRLDGLFAWLRRDPWLAAFEDVLYEHIGEALADQEMDIEELIEILDDTVAATLWGCVLEDFATREVEGIGNIVDDYLKRRGWKETAINKAYLSAIRSSVMSLYEVSDIVPGESFLARDLIRGGDPVRVQERKVSRILEPWDRFATRIVEIRGRTEMSAEALRFDPDLGDLLLESVREMARGDEDQADSAGQAITIEELRDAAPLFTDIWLEELLRRLLGDRVPDLRDSDDDPSELRMVRFPLLPDAPSERVCAALDDLPALHRIGSEPCWFWRAPPEAAEDDPAGEPGAAEFRQDSPTILGTLALLDEALIVTANSETRAARGVALLAPALDGLVGEPTVKRYNSEEAVDDMLDPDMLDPDTLDFETSQPDALHPDTLEPVGDVEEPVFDAPDPALSSEEARTIVHAKLDQHYRAVVDQPVPFLGDLTPRQAAASDDSGGRLVDWLKRLENHCAWRSPDDPMAGYDPTWLWQELGIADLRR